MEMKESLSSAASSPPSEDVPMDDAVQSSGNSGDEGAASPSNQSDSPRGGEDTDSGGGGTSRPSGATSNLAKFKASQDLRIQTANLPPKSSGNSKQRAHSVGSAAGMGLGEGEDPEEGSADDGKTPVPVPSSTGKKRRRRTAAQIDRKYPCTYPGCTKAYGSEGSLTQHQRLKHRNQSPEPGVQAAQLNNFFLPLHRTPRSLPSAPGRAAGPGGARTVTIRPAGIDGLTLHGFDVAAAAATASLVPENDTITGDFLLASPSSHTLGHSRQHLRARSNSMPISFSTTNALGMHHYTSAGPAGALLPPPPPPPSLTPPLTHLSVGDAMPSGAKQKAMRRGRLSGTPRNGGKPPLRRNKSRSKSESLQDVMEPFVLHDEIRLPTMDRSTSDSSVGFGANMGPASAPAFARPPYDWRFAIAHSQHSDSPVSSVEEAIDSDILSVLADYDTSDTGDSTLELVGSGSFEDATESSRASSSGGGRFPEPEDEWLTHQDAQYLTTHLEKMSMIHDSPPGSIPAQVMEGEDDPMTTIKLEFADPLDEMGAPPGIMKPYFPGVSSIDSFAAGSVDPPFVAGEGMKDGLKLHVSGLNDPSAVLLGRDLFENASSSGFKQEPVVPAAAPAVPAPQSSWTKELAELETYSTSGIDQADYMDVDASSYGPLQWKSIEKLRPTTSQALIGGSFDSLTAYLQHGEKHGAYASLSDTFALDTVDYAMEEPRLSSPVVCQQKDL